jgi:drug/metabolite transporter (DMT)-like permease
VLAAFLTPVLFSVSAVCGSRSTRLLGGTEANFWRLCFAALLLGLGAHSLGTGLEGTAFPLFVISGCVGFGVGDAAFFQTLPRLGSRLTSMMVTCLSSPIAAVIEWFWLGTELTPLEMICGAIILAGVAIALAPSEHLHLPAGQFTLGILFGLLAAVGQGYGAVLSRKAFEIARLAGENVGGVTAAYQRILGGVAVSLLFLVLVKRNELAQGATQPGDPELAAHRWKKWRHAWPWVLVNGLAGPALGVSCFQWALKAMPTGVVLPIVALTPVVIIPFARLVEGERPTRRSLLGGLVAVIGAVALALVLPRKG